MRPAITTAIVALAITAPTSFVLGQASNPQPAELATASFAQVDAAAESRLAKRAFRRAKRADRTARLAHSAAMRADQKAKQALTAQSRVGEFVKDLSRWTNTTTIPPGQSGIAGADCEPGLEQVIVAGGYSVPQRAAFVYSTQPIGNGWHIGVDNTAGTTDAQARVTAICAKVGKAVLAAPGL